MIVIHVAAGFVAGIVFPGVLRKLRAFAQKEVAVVESEVKAVESKIKAKL